MKAMLEVLIEIAMGAFGALVRQIVSKAGITVFGGIIYYVFRGMI